MNYQKTYDYFMAALNDWIVKTGRGSQKVLALEIKRTTGYISRLLKPDRKKPIPFEIQVDIATACGHDYLEFLELGKSIVESGSENSDTKKTQPPDASEGLNNKNTKAAEKATIQSTIRIYNNVLKRTGLKLDADGQEKLFNLIKKLLQTSDVNETEDDVYNIIRIDQYKASGDGT